MPAMIKQQLIHKYELFFYRKIFDNIESAWPLDNMLSAFRRRGSDHVPEVTTGGIKKLHLKTRHIIVKQDFSADASV